MLRRVQTRTVPMRQRNVKVRKFPCNPSLSLLHVHLDIPKPSADALPY